MGGLAVAGTLPFAVALLLALLPGARRSRTPGWVAAAFVAVSFALVLRAVPAHLDTAEVWRFGWFPALGLSFSILADGLSLLFALLISGIGVVVFSYAAAYMGDDENRRRFSCYLLLFMGAMMGVVLSANLIALYVFWELTSISSFLLIGFWHERDRSRDGALKALVVTSSGGLAMLVGFVMVAVICGSFEIPEIIAHRELLAASPWGPVAAVLVMLGAMTKSAQLPFHLWLPSAMEAPTPVSAYLHAATMVKAGLFLVARLGPLFVGIEPWTTTLTLLGLATMTWGSWMALRQTDLKALLAFSTVSQLGLILSLLAASEPARTSAGLFHLLNHGLFKGALFLLVGIIEHEAHTRDLKRLGPLRSAMPITYGCIVLASLSMAGVPPLGGFVSKELFLEHVFGMPAAWIALALVGAALTAAYCFILVVRLGRGAEGVDASALHEPGPLLLWGPAVLVLFATLLGFVPQTLVGRLIESAGAAATNLPSPELHLALWHGLTPSLGGSAAVITTGLLLYFAWWRHGEPTAPVLLADRAYAAGLRGLEIGSRETTNAYMSGLLWRYVSIIIGVVVVGVVSAFAVGGLPAIPTWPARHAEPFEILVAITAGAAAFAASLSRTRLAAILALGASGYTLALLFSLLGAPDLALTQIMVETVSVALYLAVFVFLPPYHGTAKPAFRPGHWLLSCVFGFGLVGLLYEARGSRVVETIASYYLENSVSRAGGHNVVNVILVDFRGLDTMGEITVLGVAALACFAIINLGRERASR
jgi:multicomponent Na+:H+ antiporter subunit A